MLTKKITHPAKYSDSLLPVFAKYLIGKKYILDPFAGVGKIASLKQHGVNGMFFANDIERDWLGPNDYGCDVITFEDAETLEYPAGFFDAICTSPTYGNRMADCFKASDNSKRITYTHCLGHDLKDGNTGKMQWGKKYREKHRRIYLHLYDLLEPGGLFILNISNHIRAGMEIDVSGWHKETMESIGLVLIETIEVKTPRMGYGANAKVRTQCEYVHVFKKTELKNKSTR